MTSITWIEKDATSPQYTMSLIEPYALQQKKLNAVFIKSMTRTGIGVMYPNHKYFTPEEIKRVAVYLMKRSNDIHFPKD